MNATIWQTPSIDDAERRIATGLIRLATLQAEIDNRDANRQPIPADVLDDYERQAARLAAFADAWGFDIGDVALASERASSSHPPIPYQ